jgi:hypothetical protein
LFPGFPQVDRKAIDEGNDARVTVAVLLMTSGLRASAKRDGLSVAPLR